MKIALLISLYDEIGTVEKTLRAFRSYCSDGIAICVQSKKPNIDTSTLEVLSDAYVVLPNLAGKVNRYALPSAAVCRNYSKVFSILEKFNESVDFKIAILGDTHIYDFEKLMGYLTNKMNGKKAAVLQAFGQNFHSADADPPSGKFGGRKQHPGITDIMPQLFVLRGDMGGFTNIKNTNKWTSEQNLGDELASLCDFPNDVVKLNGAGAYDFHVGVRLQA